MSTFKSWLVANIEVILIIFTVVFLIITSLIMIPKAINEENDALTNGYVVIFHAGAEAVPIQVALARMYHGAWLRRSLRFRASPGFCRLRQRLP